MTKTINDCIDMLLQDREILENIEYREGHTILLQGTVCDCAYLIVQGSIQLSYMNDGQEHKIRIASKGEIIGDLDWLNFQVHLFSARAMDHVICLKVPHENMMKHYLNSPPAIQGVLRNTVNTFRSIIGETTKVAASDVKAILCTEVPQKVAENKLKNEKNDKENTLDDMDSFSVSILD